MSDVNDFAQAMFNNASYKNSDGSYNRLRTNINEFANNEVEQVDQYSNLKKPETLSELLAFAVASNAADLHISAGAPPKYRVLNELRPVPEYGRLSADDCIRLMSQVFSEEQYQQFMQDGEIDFAYSLAGVGRFRANYYKQRGTWAGVYRMLADRIPTAQELGLPEAVQKLIDKRHGLILVTGPTGSGKSTTLACLIDMINKKYKKNIITLEDPVEYLHRHIQSNVNQREIGFDSKSFASGLRAALREDPDVILIGEMRDFETMSTALTAAETGHLVFSTLHTLGAANTIDRILDTYPTEQQAQARSQLSSVIEAIISEQLVPKADGSGRMAVFEVMLGTPAVKNIVRDRNTEQLPATMQNSHQDGMCLLDDNLIQLAKSGIITGDTALSFAINQKIVQEHIVGR